MELKALNILQKDYIGYDDFFLSCEAFIGPKNEAHIYEVYSFNVISIKRLYNSFQDKEYGIMLNRGWMIMKYYDEAEIKTELEAIIKKCQNKEDDVFYANLGTYLRIQGY